MDVAEKLNWLDREYLSAFDAVPVDSAIRYQKPFDKPVEVTRELSLIHIWRRGSIQTSWK